MPRPISATIHSRALTHNLGVARRFAPRSKIWAIVKANAYGHGLERAFPALRGADGFGLLDLDEAVRLRALGWAGPILLLEGVFSAADLAWVERYSLTPTVHCNEQLKMLESVRPQAPISIHLKMNTGMNRLGFAPARFRAAWERARSIAGVGQISLMTHFADADGQAGVAHQMDAFEAGTAAIMGERSCANSAATLWHPQTHFDWVRPGIMLYGGSPSGRRESVETVGLQAAMTFSSELIATQTLEAGDAVGYGSRFIAEAPLKVGVVACGYADGYPRHAPSGTPIAVDGTPTRTLGRVSMDMLTVDLTPCANARVGSPVELWGAQVPIDDVGVACDTIGYELMCAVAPRVPVRTD